MDKRRERFIDYGLKVVNRSLDSIDKLKRFSERSNYIVDSSELREIVNQLKEKVSELENHYFANEIEPKFFSIKPKEISEKERQWEFFQKKNDELFSKLQHQNHDLLEQYKRVSNDNLMILERLSVLEKVITKNSGKG
jgi:HJR/Mrr/RecB family endonuclease